MKCPVAVAWKAQYRELYFTCCPCESTSQVGGKKKCRCIYEWVDMGLAVPQKVLDILQKEAEELECEWLTQDAMPLNDKTPTDIAVGALSILS